MANSQDGSGDFYPVKQASFFTKTPIREGQAATTPRGTLDLQSGMNTLYGQAQPLAMQMFADSAVQHTGDTTTTRMLLYRDEPMNLSQGLRDNLEVQVYTVVTGSGGTLYVETSQGTASTAASAAGWTTVNAAIGTTGIETIVIKVALTSGSDTFTIRSVRWGRQQLAVATAITENDDGDFTPQDDDQWSENYPMTVGMTRDAAWNTFFFMRNLRRHPVAFCHPLNTHDVGTGRTSPQSPLYVNSDAPTHIMSWYYTRRDFVKQLKVYMTGYTQDYTSNAASFALHWAVDADKGDDATYVYDLAHDGKTWDFLDTDEVDDDTDGTKEYQVEAQLWPTQDSDADNQLLIPQGSGPHELQLWGKRSSDSQPGTIISLNIIEEMAVIPT